MARPMPRDPPVTRTRFADTGAECTFETAGALQRGEPFVGKERKLLAMKLTPICLGVAVASTGILAAASTRSNSPAETPNKKLTYATDVAPILNEHCVQCHRPNQVAP